MVTVNATRTYLRTVIGLGNDAEGYERANAVIEEGLDDLSEIGELAEGDGIKTLCSSVRKPAGTMPQPGWVAPDPNPNQLTAPRVARIGKVIPVICEQRLTLAAYGADIYTSIGRTVEPALLSRSRLREFKMHRATVENHNDPESLPEISKSYTIMKFLDQLPTYLQQVLGVSKVALAYLVRKETAPMDRNPPEMLPELIGGNVPRPWSEQHRSLMEELIAFTPHSGPAYDADNAQLYNLLSTHLGNTTAMASITRHGRRRDGRGAYKDLVTHHMGSAKWEKIVESAEGILSNRVWNGKNSRYPLKIHIARHREAFNDLKRAESQIAYAAPNEASRVRYLLTSIQTSDPTICAGKATIQADVGKKNSFEEAADFLMTICPPPKPQAGNTIHRVSALKLTKKGKIRIGPKTGVEIRYYKRHEWEKLTREEQKEVREHRQKQMKRKAEDEAKGDHSSKIAALESMIEKQNQVIATLRSGNDDIPLPPKPKNNPLKPPAGFAQRE